MSENIEYYYQLVSKHPSDINEHLPVLYEYAKTCSHITEFGVRSVVSTWAFLRAKPSKLISYDIEYHPNIEMAKKLAKEEGVDFEYRLQDVLLSAVEPTEFLFIDTLHTYDQLKQELALHGNKASKYLGFHDTTTFAHKGENGDMKGLLPAIEEFLKENSHWKEELRKTNNNGLTILKRV